MSTVPMPTPLKKFYSLFPLHVYPQTENLPSPSFGSSRNSEKDEEGSYRVKDTATNPILFILPPRDASKSLLSSDIECVKWQAYLALRGVPGGIKMSWSLASEGALEARLPNLYLPPPKRLLQNKTLRSTNEIKGELLESSRIPSWVDGEIGKITTDDDKSGILEGYRNEEARDESRAWMTLLEGDIDAAFVATAPTAPILTRLTTFTLPTPMQRPIPSTSLTGWSSIIPPVGNRILQAEIMERYAEGVAALSTRLKQDRWFLGSRYGIIIFNTSVFIKSNLYRKPTALDAVAFAYVCAALESPHPQIREHMEKWVNLVAWEKKVRGMVEESLNV